MLVLDGGEQSNNTSILTRLTAFTLSVWLQYLKHFRSLHQSATLRMCPGQSVCVVSFFVQVGWDSTIPLHLNNTKCGILKLKVFLQCTEHCPTTVIATI